MAHETLKATIRQYIGPNGQNSITGQIMQNILIAMVDEYPDITGYATQAWVQQQGYVTASALSGYATQSWVNTQLGGFLPLTGGTLTGDLNLAYSSKLYFGTSYIDEYTIPGPHGTNMGHILNFNGVDGNGYYNFDNSVHATSFVKIGGTSAQFLKADGSVDENTYLVPGSRISLLGNDVGYLTSADLSGYARTSDLSAYLPLSGGTMTGDLNMAAYKLYFGTSYIDEYTIPGPQGTNMGHILNFNGVDGNGYYNFDNSVHATSFVKSGGTSAQFLKADGSVDSNTYITASALTGYATQAWVQQQGYITASALSGYATQAWVNTQLGGYLPLTGGTLTGDLIINSGGTSYFRIYGSGNDGYGLISVDSDGLLINALNTAGGYVYLNPDVYVSGGLEVGENLNVTNKASIDGECYAASFIQTSDITKKNILGNVGLSLHDVANAPLFDFTWKDSEDKRNHVGTSAQYWQSVMPQVVSDTADVLGLQYDVTALACAITVAKTVVDHEERIKNLESKFLS